VAAAVLVGCGAETESETQGQSWKPQIALDPPDVTVSLDGQPSPANVGILMAQDRGYFDDAGLTVQANIPLTPERSVPYVSSNTVDLAVAQQPQVVLARAKGARIVAIGSLLPRSTISMIWLNSSRIDGVAGLRGKTIAVPGIPYQRKLLRHVLAQAGMTLEDAEVEIVGYDLVSALVSGRADAIFGGSENLEGAALEARGLEPVVTPVSRLGIPGYEELVVIARSPRVAGSPRLARKFMTAVARGTAAAVQDPEAAVESVEKKIEENSEQDEKPTPEDIEAEMEATLPLLSRTGYMDSAQANDFARWMFAQGLIEGKPLASELLTNRYLPSQP
jgi:putative hydroxymethylpyrimidine transport system substrate-binding protein